MQGGSSEVTGPDWKSRSAVRLEEIQKRMRPRRLCLGYANAAAWHNPADPSSLTLKTTSALFSSYHKLRQRAKLRSFRNGKLLRCSSKLQMYPLPPPPAADYQLSVTGRPEIHAGQGMASQSRQRDINTIPIGRFCGIHRQNPHSGLIRLTTP